MRPDTFSDPPPYFDAPVLLGRLGFVLLIAGAVVWILLRLAAPGRVRIRRAALGVAGAGVLGWLVSVILLILRIVG